MLTDAWRLRLFGMLPLANLAIASADFLLYDTIVCSLISAMQSHSVCPPLASGYLLHACDRKI